MISTMYIKMPYKLRKARNKDLYWVVDTTGDKYSKKPIPLARAKKQIVALHINTGHGRGGYLNTVVDKIIEMFDRGITEDVIRMSIPLYMDNPTEQQVEHSIAKAKELISKRVVGRGDEGYSDELAMFSKPSPQERREKRQELADQIRRAEEKQRQAVQAMIEAEKRRVQARRPRKKTIGKFNPVLEPILEVHGYGLCTSKPDQVFTVENPMRKMTTSATAIQRKFRQRHPPQLDMFGKVIPKKRSYGYNPHTGEELLDEDYVGYGKASSTLKDSYDIVAEEDKLDREIEKIIDQGRAYYNRYANSARRRGNDEYIPVLEAVAKAFEAEVIAKPEHREQLLKQFDADMISIVTTGVPRLDPGTSGAFSTDTRYERSALPQTPEFFPSPAEELPPSNWYPYVAPPALTIRRPVEDDIHIPARPLPSAPEERTSFAPTRPRGSGQTAEQQLYSRFNIIYDELLTNLNQPIPTEWIDLFNTALETPIYKATFQSLIPQQSYEELTAQIGNPDLPVTRRFKLLVRDSAKNMMDALQNVMSKQNSADTDPNGGKLKHIKKYLKGMGIRATKKNIDHAISACDAEGVVF